jgi:hypothetical protein
MAQPMLFKCTLMSAEVCEITLRSSSFLSSFDTEWSSGNRNQVIVWSPPTSIANVIYHSVRLQSQAEFNEISNQAEWGNLYYATTTVSDNYVPVGAFLCSLTVYL